MHAPEYDEVGNIRFNKRKSGCFNDIEKASRLLRLNSAKYFKIGQQEELIVNMSNIRKNEIINDDVIWQNGFLLY